MRLDWEMLYYTAVNVVIPILLSVSDRFSHQLLGASFCVKCVMQHLINISKRTRNNSYVLVDWP